MTTIKIKVRDGDKEEREEKERLAEAIGVTKKETFIRGVCGYCQSNNMRDGICDDCDGGWANSIDK